MSYNLVPVNKLIRKTAKIMITSDSIKGVSLVEVSEKLSTLHDIYTKIDLDA